MVNPFIDDREPLGGLGGLGIMGQAQMSERFYNPNADREYSKFQVRANEAEERKNIEDMYSGLKSWGKNPMFFETMVPPPGLNAEIFSNEKIRNDPAMDLMSLPFDADMTPSFGMKDIEKWMDTPRYEAKTNPNLGGAKVQQAGAFDFLERWMPWYDKEQDEKRYKPYIDPEIEQDRLEDEEKDKAEWLSEYGPRETSEFYPDKILRDLYPQAFGGQEPYTTDEELNNLLEGLEPEDLGMEPQLEAQSQWKRPENMEKTIQALKLRPEFEGWTDEAIKTWIYNTARSNRGGIIGLL